MLSDQEWRRRRRPQMERAGIDERSIDYLLALERGTLEAVVASVAQLSREARWEGRLAILPTGIWLKHEGGVWRVCPDPPSCPGYPS